MNDLISRKAAIDALEAIGQNYNLAKAYVVGVIEEVPSAEPERKKGHWINDRLVTTNGGTYAVRRCPFCESYYQDVGYGWNYCPNCGARMEE